MPKAMTERSKKLENKLYILLYLLNSLPKSGDSKDNAAATRKNRHKGRWKKILKEPSLIISEPTKFCSAILPKIMPIIIADIEKPILLRK